MWELSAGDKFHIPGRGDVYTFEGIPGLDGRTLLGELVRIDGILFRVKGVEHYLIQHQVGLPFGLLVEPVPEYS